MSSNDTTTADPTTAVLWAPDHGGHDTISTRTLGFWLYMIGDAMIFGTLFTAYFVLDHNYAGGPTAADVLHLSSAFVETILVLFSVLSYGLSMSALKRGSQTGVMAWIIVAFITGAAFLGMEIHEFTTFIEHGITPEVSGYLSAVYVLVFTHGLHMLLGLLWMAVMLVQILRDGFTENVVYRLLNLRIFWHFQAVIWVCMFTFVYLQGSL